MAEEIQYNQWKEKIMGKSLFVHMYENGFWTNTLEKELGSLWLMLWKQFLTAIEIVRYYRRGKNYTRKS